MDPPFQPRDPATLDALLAPRSVAVIGASDDVTRIGGRPLDYLLRTFVIKLPELFLLGLVVALTVGLARLIRGRDRGSGPWQEWLLIGVASLI